MFPECKIVAEIGATHVGSINRAKDLIRLAALAGATYVKLQKRNPVESVPIPLQNKPHPNETFAYGSTYLEHRQNLELTIDEHRELKKYCESIGIGYASSVWDITSAREIISLQPDYIKVPSACTRNLDLLTFLKNEFDGEIHISTGMITNFEKEGLFDVLDTLGIKRRTVLYHCTSEYPCPFERLYLLEISRLRKFSDVKCIGYSNHGYGIASDVAAYVLGAEWIERHFIDDRTFRHTDASASLEPDGMRRLVRDLQAVRKSLMHKTSLSAEEKRQRAKLAND